MPRRFRPGLAALAFFTGLARAADPSPEVAESRGLAFLAVEVPRWATENRCRSCHNNGDAAKALYLARRFGRPEGQGDPLANTSDWLARPEGWEHNGGEGPFSDKVLARIAFTATLASARESGSLQDRSPLIEAAVRLAADQGEDGSWPIEEGQGTIGGPASYGRPLAALVARDTLRRTDPQRFLKHIDRANTWLRSQPVARVLDASVALLAFPDDPDPRRGQALKTLREGRSADGGWGPFVEAPPEPFDTALVLLALVRQRPDIENRRWIAEGRDFLSRTQNPEGSWPETTRPAGLESYAQRISTAGWAVQALLATSGRPQGDKTRPRPTDGP